MSTTKRVKGFSVGTYDAVAVAGIVAGVLTAIFTGQTVGSVILHHTGSVWLATCAWVAVLLVAMTLILAGFAYLVSASRNYRYPSVKEEVLR